MCGIAGILRLHEPADGPPPPPDAAIPESWLDTLDDAIKHRGPDGHGRFRDRATRPDGTVVDVALTHRRLSILDHEGGHQPMVHAREPDQSDLIAVSFNGCIYNHRELRRELEARGHVFQTDHSDTEVLIHGWREWGLQMQDHLDGMYAFILWDRGTAQLAWARDLAGEKPLYEALDPLATSETRIYASTANAAVRFEAMRDATFPRLSPSILGDWVRDGAFMAPPMMIGNAFPGGTHSSDTRPRSQQREGSTKGGVPSTSKVLQEVPPRSSDPAPSNTRETITRAIERAITSRLEADVPLGVFLSGGLDSALIAAIAHKDRPDLRAFTVRMPHPDYDESQAAAETAGAIGVDHTVLECDVSSPTGPADDLVRLIEQLGLPFGDSSLLPTYWVSRAAREHIKVALSGDGGDELFGGYRRHTIAPALHRWRSLLRLTPTRLLDQRRPGTRTTYLARLATAARHAGYADLLAIFPTPDLRRLIPSVQPVEFDPIDDPLRHDFDTYLPDDLLRKTDTASMAVALEVRAPFLARELVNAALGTPLDVLMPNGERKGLLKKIARAHLPHHIVDRPKQGFAIPIGEWFRTDFGGMRTLLHDHLLSAEPFPGLAGAGIELNMSFVRTMLREHDAAGERSINPWHGRDHAQRLYMLVVLSIWCRWLERSLTDAPAA